MQKNFIAAAVVGALFAPLAMAQSSLTIYGVADVGVEVADSGLGKVARVQSGQQSGSRLGFKGTEDLGNGLSALFTLEMGIAFDTGATSSHGTNGGDGATLFGRQAFAGLKSATLGQVTLGRQVTPFYQIKVKADPFANGLNGIIGNLAGVVPGNSDRWNNQIAYASPKFGDFTVGAAYSTGTENNTNVNPPGNVTTARDAGKSWGLIGQYVKGPIYAGLAYHRLNASTATTAPATGTFAPTNVATSEGWYLGSSYDLTVAKLFVNVMTGKQTQDGVSVDVAKGNLIDVGVRLPFNAHAVTVGYSQAKNKVTSSADAKQLTVAYEYALSKRTNLYASVAKLTNETNSSFRLSNGNGTGLTLSGNGADPKSLLAGIRHTF